MVRTKQENCQANPQDVPTKPWGLDTLTTQDIVLVLAWYPDRQMDTRTRAQRSAIMRAVRGRDTGPEIAVRSLVHRLGYRFRLHRRDLPGTPDLVFPSRRNAIFVHGCFWHGHKCRYGRLPKSRIEFWAAKIARNAERDKENVRALKRLGWSSFCIWQCELRKPKGLSERLVRFLGSHSAGKRRGSRRKTTRVKCRRRGNHESSDRNRSLRRRRRA